MKLRIALAAVAVFVMAAATGTADAATAFSVKSEMLDVKAGALMALGIALLKRAPNRRQRITRLA